MSPRDWLCFSLFALVLVAIGALMFRQAYMRAHPKRRPSILTGWEDGRG